MSSISNKLVLVIEYFRNWAKHCTIYVLVNPHLYPTCKFCYLCVEIGKLSLREVT